MQNQALNLTFQAQPDHHENGVIIKFKANLVKASYSFLDLRLSKID